MGEFISMLHVVIVCFQVCLSRSLQLHSDLYVGCFWGGGSCGTVRGMNTVMPLHP
jgi:hypothetical protein